MVACPVQYSTWWSISIICMHFGKSIKFNRFVVHKRQFLDSPFIFQVWFMVGHDTNLDLKQNYDWWSIYFTSIFPYHPLKKNSINFHFSKCSPLMLFIIWFDFTILTCGSSFQVSSKVQSANINVPSSYLFILWMIVLVQAQFVVSHFKYQQKFSQKIKMDRQAI